MTAARAVCDLLVMHFQGSKREMLVASDAHTHNLQYLQTFAWGSLPLQAFAGYRPVKMACHFIHAKCLMLQCHLRPALKVMRNPWLHRNVGVQAP